MYHHPQIYKFQFFEAFHLLLVKVNWKGGEDRFTNSLRYTTTGQKAGVTQEGSDSVTSSRKEPFQGWALKTQTKGQRTTQNVKNFLLEKFNRGVETANSS